jgi:putative membrane protein
VTVAAVSVFDPFALAAGVMVVIVAALHLYFLVLEMFLWRTPFGLRTFRMSREAADSTAVLAGNQGLYNGFLAAGLIFGLVAGRPVVTFFLLCVIVAGIYGAATVSRRILVVQAVPAAIALALVWLAK